MGIEISAASGTCASWPDVRRHASSKLEDSFSYFVDHQGGLVEKQIYFVAIHFARCQRSNMHFNERSNSSVGLDAL